jgi:hypothetical protein
MDKKKSKFAVDPKSDPVKFQQSVDLINKLADKAPSMRAFARSIYEQVSDVSRWCAGLKHIKLRAVIEICRLYPEIRPHQLNHMIFPEDLVFTFTKEGKK